MRKSILCILLLSIVFSSLSMVNTFAVSSDLIAHYKFEGDFKDSSGNGLDGTKIGAVSFDDKGKVGKCANFSQGVVNLTKSDKWTLGKKYTISAWVKVDSKILDTQEIGTLFAKSSEDNGLLYQLQAYGTTSFRYEQIFENNQVTMYSEEVNSAEKWSLITMTSDGSSVQMYVDGKLDKVEVISEDFGNSVTSSRSATIGSNYYNEYFVGKIDELKIYNKFMEEPEILNEYNAGNVFTNKIELKIYEPKMLVDNAEVEVDPGRGTYPTIEEGRTLLPIRTLIETMGGNIEWDGTDKKVTVNYKGKKIELWIDNKEAKVDGKSEILDVPPKIINERTMLPLRFIAENLGCKVDWEATTKKVTISYSK